jgi:putative phosphoesterase
MKILLISDSHGHKERIPSILDRHKDLDFVLHLGDYGTDVDAVAEACPGIPSEAVRGNNDKTLAYPLEKVIQLAGKRIFITHGHTYNVGRSLNALVAKASQEGASIAAFGHTHVPLIERRDGILLVNPGCLFRPRSLHGMTYSILKLTLDTTDANLFSV